ncbi:unnamed protein product [Ectocarpus sp. 12 AP-2014]
MTGRTNYRVQSASALMALLLALAGIVAATATPKSVTMGGPLIRRSLATSDVGEDCAAEIAACEADSSCVDCNEVFFDNYDGCTGFATTIPCDEMQEDFCCALADEAEECYSDTTFTNYAECLYSSLNSGCISSGYNVDISDCNGAMGRATAWGLPSTLISATVGALLVAAFGSSVV